jgi:hypothetical protein
MEGRGAELRGRVASEESPAAALDVREPHSQGQHEEGVFELVVFGLEAKGEGAELCVGARLERLSGQGSESGFRTEGEFCVPGDVLVQQLGGLFVTFLGTPAHLRPHSIAQIKFTWRCR